VSTTTTKLTERSVAELKATGRDYKVFDAQVPGFHVRVHPSGLRTFAVFYRNTDGRQRTKTLGRVGVLKAEKARTLALDLLGQVREGRDPSAERKERKPVTTMADLFAEYLEKHARPKKARRSVAEDECLWRLHLEPALGDLKLDRIGQRDLDGFMAKMKPKPGAANRSMALISKMMSLAVAWKLRADNPAATVDRYPENRKERFLSTDEAERVLQALDADQDRSGATAIKLLLLTGARRSEVLHATWSQFDLNEAAPLWIVPREHLKGAVRVRSDLRRPLSLEAARLLRDWRSQAAVTSLMWVFPNAEDASRPKHDLKRVWNRVRSAASVKDVRLHDLRHSYASFAVRAGHSLHVIGKALGHRDLRTTERYAHVLDESLRDLATNVSNAIGGRN
jgi:integrase